MDDEQERQTTAAAPLPAPSLVEQVRLRLPWIWKPIAFTCCFFGIVLLVALWLALSHHSPTAANQIPNQNAPDVSTERLDQPPPPAPVTPRPQAAPPADTTKPNPLNECGGIPCPAPPQQQQGQPMQGPLAGASGVMPQQTPQQDYEQKLKQYQLAAAMASPDDQIESPAAQPVPQAQPTQPPPIKPEAAFPPVTTREQEIGQEKNASYDSATGKQYRLFGGVDSISARLDNEIIGDFDGPFTATVVTNLWSQDHEAVVIPQGAKLIGRCHRVSDGDQERLQAEVYKIWMPDGWVTSFDTAPVLSASGATGLTGKVNHHYAQVFLTAIGISAVGATAQVGNYQSSYGYDPGVEIRNGLTRGAGEAAQEVLGRRARIRNTIKVRTGTLIDLPLSADLILPDWRNHTVDPHI